MSAEFAEPNVSCLRRVDEEKRKKNNLSAKACRNRSELKFTCRPRKFSSMHKRKRQYIARVVSYNSKQFLIYKRDRHVNSARNLALHGKRLVEQNKALRQVLLEIGIKSEFESQMIQRVRFTQ